MNSFGRIFRVAIFGESHGTSIGVLIDGIPSGIPLQESDFHDYIDRRKSKGSRSALSGHTPRMENDAINFMSGLYNHKTTGAPLTLMFENMNTRSSDYTELSAHPRPSHADWVAAHKFNGYNDPRGGGHFSGRLTLALVAAGTVARATISHLAAQDLSVRPIDFHTKLVEIGGSTDPSTWQDMLCEAQEQGDSLGAIVECRVNNLPVGLGEPFFDSMESCISHIIFSIPGVKGIEFGSGFGSAAMRGSDHNDPIISESGETSTNNAGGIVGGISNGNELVVRVAFKPTASISKTQNTWNLRSHTTEPLNIKGRHDTCIAMRGAVVVEASIAIAIADLLMQHRSRL